MRHRRWALRVHDMLQAVRDIGEFTDGLTFAEFIANRTVFNATQYSLLIMGEAATHVPDDVQTQAPGVPWNQIRGFRNILAHEYFRIDNGILWNIITNELPAIDPILQALLESEKTPDE